MAEFAYNVELTFDGPLSREDLKAVAEGVEACVNSGVDYEHYNGDESVGVKVTELGELA